MDLYKIRPVEEPRLVREQPPRGQRQDRPAVKGATEPANAPPHDGGVTAAPESQPGKARDASDETGIRERAARRRGVLEEFARYANLPPETRLAIAVDVEQHETRFQILDKDTGEVLKEIPEPEGVSLLQRLMQLGTSLVDERL